MSICRKREPAIRSTTAQVGVHLTPEPGGADVDLQWPYAARAESIYGRVRWLITQMSQMSILLMVSDVP